MSSLYLMADIARELGVTVQAVRDRHLRAEQRRAAGLKGNMPAPDAYTVKGWPLWYRGTLEEAGILLVLDNVK